MCVCACVCVCVCVCVCMCVCFCVFVCVFVHVVCGTADIQVYKQTCVMRCASRNFEDNSQGIHCSQAIIDKLKILASNNLQVVNTCE